MKTKIPPLDLKSEFRELRGALENRIQRVLAGGQYILGQEVEKFERAFAHFVGTKYAVGVASGTDALLISLMALGVKAGDEIITTPFTFISTATVIIRLGARPVFVDIDLDTCNLDPDLIEQKITRRTRGIIPVHLYGTPCRMDKIRQIAKKHGLFILEDCAQACGATFHGKRVGTFSEFGAFSFYPTKTLGAFGDAGAISTNDRKLYEQAKSLRHHGESTRNHSYHHKLVGINSRLDEIQAAILSTKLKHLTYWNRARRKAAERYHRLIQKFRLQVSIVSSNPPYGKSVFHQYVIRTRKRDQLRHSLLKGGIWVGVYYPVPLHLQPCFRFLGYQRGDFPQCESASAEVLSLPLYPQIDPADQNRVITEIKKSL